MEELREYLNSLSSSEQSVFAKGCATSIGYLRKAISRNQRLGIDLVISIEKHSAGHVSCQRLRPDIDWAFLRQTAGRRKRTA